MNQYTYHTTVLNADGDFRRMIKPSALFRYVEQAAADHARAYGMDDAFFKAHHTAVSYTHLTLPTKPIV